MWLDPDKIDQVLENLVENALRHGAGTITVRVHGTGAGAEVTVTDEGEGIPSELHTRIFAKFWRGQPRRGGTGLGLYITKGSSRRTAGRSPPAGPKAAARSSDSSCPPAPLRSPDGQLLPPRAENLKGSASRGFAFLVLV